MEFKFMDMIVIILNELRTNFLSQTMIAFKNPYNSVSAVTPFDGQ